MVNVTARPNELGGWTCELSKYVSAHSVWVWVGIAYCACRVQSSSSVLLVLLSVASCSGGVLFAGPPDESTSEQQSNVELEPGALATPVRVNGLLPSMGDDFGTFLTSDEEVLPAPPPVKKPRSKAAANFVAAAAKS